MLKGCHLGSSLKLFSAAHRESDTRFSASSIFHKSVFPGRLSTSFQIFCKNLQRYSRINVYQRYCLWVVNVAYICTMLVLDNTFKFEFKIKLLFQKDISVGPLSVHSSVLYRYLTFLTFDWCAENGGRAERGSRDFWRENKTGNLTCSLHKLLQFAHMVYNYIIFICMRKFWDFSLPSIAFLFSAHHPLPAVPSLWANLKPILHMWIRDSFLIGDVSSAIQVFPLIFYIGMAI